MRLTRLLVALLGAIAAFVVPAASMTTARAVAHAYDAPALAHVDAQAFRHDKADPTQVSEPAERSAPHAVLARGASTTSSRLVVATEAAGVGPVNVVSGSHNCVSCAIAGDSTLAGDPASALNLHPGVPIPGGNAAIEAYAGAPWRSVAGRGAIESELLQAGNGARGIVYGTNGKTAHVWNAIVQDGNVNFVDDSRASARADPRPSTTEPSSPSCGRDRSNR